MTTLPYQARELAQQHRDKADLLEDLAMKIEELTKHRDHWRRIAESLGECPQFIHDCECCVFVGRYEVEDGPANGNYDLYVPMKERTVLARFGDDGPEYISGLAFRESYPALAEAYRRAVSRGILKDGE